GPTSPDWRGWRALAVCDPGSRAGPAPRPRRSRRPLRLLLRSRRPLLPLRAGHALLQQGHEVQRLPRRLLRHVPRLQGPGLGLVADRVEELVAVAVLVLAR